MKKRVLILNGNSRVIQRAKSLDLEVVILQRENSPLNKKELSKADYYLEVDYHNTDLLFSTVSSFLNKYPVDSIISFSEDALLPTVLLQEKFNMPTNSLQTVLLLKNKNMMRDYLNKRNFSRVEFQIGTSKQDIINFIEINKCSIILKSLHGTGSEGILKINSIRELIKFDPWIRKFKIKEFLIEEFLDGVEVSVEAFSFKGKHSIIGITDKIVGENFIEFGHSVPTMLKNDTVSKVKRFTEKFLNHINLQFGPSHTEIKLTKNGPKIIESHNRPGGDGIVHLHKLVFGVDVVYWTLSAIKEGREMIEYEKHTCGGAAVRFLDLPAASKVKVVSSMEHLNQDSIYRYEINVKTGDMIKVVEKSRDRLGYVIAKGKSPQDAIEICEHAIDQLGIQLE
ncbi:ATP-grasp domain-containing protein [Bacillus safensis]|uniref:ATP-grasp domain-containing protein n=1 Tax=Bacillus safensis TaxID=561879 RepID=UPI001BAAF0CA|nr:ATP-grasp domain-containing protein [Bacillus safensis]MBR0607495.1 ATP-grasp domain-containing protein [Bacillus safensis]WJE39809.1 ATP-grasp domain-containing protein [Bacillus safensis]